jgi:polyisoprenoid-binding protein YceI
MNMFTIIMILFLLERADPYYLANAQCNVTFHVINAGLEVEGTLKVKHANIRFDPDNIRHASIQVSADPSSIETGIGIRDKHLRRRDYFDTNSYPEIQLKSKSFSKRGKNEFTGKFDLTIKSTTKEIIIPFTRKEKGNITYYEADFEINRLDFNIGEESLTLDETVRVSVSAVGNFRF